MKFRLISYLNQKPAWYLVINNLDELFNHTKRYNSFLFRTTFQDPHFGAELDKGIKEDRLTMADLRHPIKLGAARTLALSQQILNCGEVLINKVGGWMTFNSNCKILEEKESNEWPGLENHKKYGYIKIKKWALGNHFYLISWPKALPFSEEKFNTYNEAFNEAKKWVKEDRIHFEENAKFIYSENGG